MSTKKNIHRMSIIMNRLYSGQILDVEVMRVACAYSNTTSVNSALTRVKNAGGNIVKIHPKRGLYAMAGSPPALDAARKYRTRPATNRIIPYAWDPRVNNNEPQPPQGELQISKATEAPFVSGPPPRLLSPDPPPPPAAGQAPIRLVIICPNGCSPPEILKDEGSGMVIIETGGRPLDVRIATKYV